MVVGLRTASDGIVAVGSIGVCLTGSSFDVKLMVSCSNPKAGEVPFFMLFAVYASQGSFVGAATTVNVEFAAVSPSAFVKLMIRSPDVVRAPPVGLVRLLVAMAALMPVEA